MMGPDTVRFHICVECGETFKPHMHMDSEESCNLCRIAESLRQIADAVNTSVEHFHWK